MADLRDYTKKNPVFVGTDGIRLPKGNNAQRTASSNVAGTMRYNTDIDGIETYTTAGWRPLAAPPSISTVSPTTYTGESGTQFIINGEGFTPDAQVYFITANSTALLAASVSYYSAVQVRATTPRAIKIEEEPISVRVVQQSGTVTLTNCIDAGGVPTWVTTGGALGSIFGANVVNVYVTATDPEGTAVSYQLNSGSLPGGLSLSANGLIQGLATSVLANTTYNFVIKANDTVNNNTDRSFSYTVLNRAPVINTAPGLVATIYSGNAVPSTTISAYDPDGGQITFSAPTGNIVNTTVGSANGTIIGTPIVVTTNTTYTIGVAATDEGSLSTSSDYSFTVLNRPPIINTATGSLGTIYSGNSINVTIDAYDPDGAAVSYAITSGNLMATANIGTSNGVITASNNLIVLANTTYNFTVRATDVGNDSVSNNYTFTVLNRPPLWNTAATLPSADGNYNNTITVNAYDPDGGSVTYALTSGSLPSGLSFVTSNGTIVGTAPEVESNTTSTFTVTATDVGNDANARTFSLTITPITDSSFSNTVLLLKTAGNTVLKDASSNNINLTVVGDTRVTNFSQYNTSRSVYFDGSSYLSLGSSADFAYGTGDFSMECWIFTSNASSQRMITHTEDSFNLDFNSSGQIQFFVGGVGALTTTSPYYLESFRWHHVAVTRNGSALRIFTNGKLAYYNSSMTASKGTGGLNVGHVNGSGIFNGYIADVRVVKGGIPSAYFTFDTALGSQSFSPPTSRLSMSASLTGGSVVALLCNNPHNTDATYSPKSVTYTGSPKVSGYGPYPETDLSSGAMYFDGSGDYIDLATNEPFNFYDQDFTLECWFWQNSVSGGYTPVIANQGGGDGNGWILYNESNNYLSFTWSASGGGWTSFGMNTGFVLSANAWHHVVIQRSGGTSGTLNMWVDGILRSTKNIGSTAFQTVSGGTGSIGRYAHFPGGQRTSSGYISDVRVVKGSAVYTANAASITVPTSPLSNVANTKLLTLQNRQPHNNHGFQDSSNNKNLITRNGNVTQGTFSPFSTDPGKWSVYNSGSSSFCQLNNSNYTISTGDFTIEFWMFVTGDKTYSCFCSASSNPNFTMSLADGSTNSRNLYLEYGGSGTSISGITNYLNTWTHIAVVRSSGTVTVYKNGISVGSASKSAAVGDTANFYLLRNSGDSNQDFPGYISNFRICKSAVYTSNFTPSTLPLTTTSQGATNCVLLTFQDNRFKDNSSTAATITPTATSIRSFSLFTPNSVYTTANTGGSGYFDSSGDYLLLPNSPQFTFNSDFTIEAWIYSLGYTGSDQFIATGNVPGSWGFAINGSGSLACDDRGSGYINSGSTYIPRNAWTHVAWSHVGGTTSDSLYINGVRVATGSGRSFSSTSSGSTIGASSGGNFPFNGFISNLRILKGTALYSGATITVPTSLSGSTPNTVVLLLNFDKAAIIDQTSMNNFETVGDAKANNTIQKFTPGSYSFDGTGDSLVSYNNVPIGTSDYTVEAWVYKAVAGTGVYSIFCTGPGGSNDNLRFGVNNNGIYLDIYGVNPFASVGTVPDFTWTHVAVTRTGGTVRAFVNGILVSSTTSTGSTSITGTQWYAGILGTTGGAPGWNGSIQDLRVSRVARYTTNFTPPTRSFPNR